MLQQMDNEISSTIQNEDEIIEFTAIQEAVQDKLTEIKAILNSPTITTTHPLNVSTTEFVLSSNDHLTPPSRREKTISRLPKLNLPSCAGDPLTWQSFWDSLMLLSTQIQH